MRSEDLAMTYSWPRAGRWVRGMVVTTLDGSIAGPDGRSRSISCPNDRNVMAEARRLADVVLIGASTMRAERYSPMNALPEDQAARAALGLGAAPRLVIVSISLDLPWDEPAFPSSEFRPLVVTTAAAPASARLAAEEAAELLVLPGDRVDMADLFVALEERALRRIVCEGGARLMADIVSAGALDELNLTIAPVLTGPGPRMLEGIGSIFEPLQLAHLHTEDGYIYTRYLRPQDSTTVRIGI